MAVIRVIKNKNYTVMSNNHLKNKKMSLKAKGLLSMMLSLPDTWSYNFKGIVNMCKESERSVKTALNELKELKYLEITKERDNKGRFTYIYNIYENPGVRFPPVDSPGVENAVLLNTNIVNTKNKRKDKKKIKKSEYEQREYTKEFFETMIANNKGSYIDNKSSPT